MAAPVFWQFNTSGEERHGRNDSGEIEVSNQEDREKLTHFARDFFYFIFYAILKEHGGGGWGKMMYGGRNAPV